MRKLSWRRLAGKAAALTLVLAVLALAAWVAMGGLALAL